MRTPHLSPHQVSHAIHARFVEAQAEQANKHNEEQDNVGDEGGDYVQFRAVDVAYLTGGHRGHPRNTDLGMGIST
jgi:hypothetical protein